MAKIVLEDDNKTFPAEVIVNATSELSGISTDPVTILECIEHVRSGRPGYENFGSVENAIAYFARFGSKVEVRENFDDVIAALTSGILGSANEMESKTD